MHIIKSKVSEGTAGPPLALYPPPLLPHPPHPFPLVLKSHLEVFCACSILTLKVSHSQDLVPPLWLQI